MPYALGTSEEDVLRIKREFDLAGYCSSRGCSELFTMAELCRNLSHDEHPDYSALQNLLQKLGAKKGTKGSYSVSAAAVAVKSTAASKVAKVRKAPVVGGGASASSRSATGKKRTIAAAAAAAVEEEDEDLSEEEALPVPVAPRRGRRAAAAAAPVAATSSRTRKNTSKKVVIDLVESDDDENVPMVSAKKRAAVGAGAANRRSLSQSPVRGSRARNISTQTSFELSDGEQLDLKTEKYPVPRKSRAAVVGRAAKKAVS